MHGRAAHRRRILPIVTAGAIVAGVLAAAGANHPGVPAASAGPPATPDIWSTWRASMTRPGADRRAPDVVPVVAAPAAHLHPRRRLRRGRDGRRQPRLPPNNDQLQLDETPSTFPFIWIAAVGPGHRREDRHADRRGPGRVPDAARRARGGNPSRTTVDLDGNVWVGQPATRRPAPARSCASACWRPAAASTGTATARIDTSTGLARRAGRGPTHGDADDCGRRDHGRGRVHHQLLPRAARPACAPSPSTPTTTCGWAASPTTSTSHLDGRTGAILRQRRRPAAAATAA